MEKKKLLLRLDAETETALEFLASTKKMTKTALINKLIIDETERVKTDADLKAATAASRAAESAANVCVGVLNSMMWAMNSMADSAYRSDPHAIISGATLAEKNKRFNKVKGDPV